MAVLLLVSKGAGFLRESVVASAFGAGLVKDSQTVAYILPALFLILLGGLNGPFHLATMGAITRLQARGEGERVRDLVATILVGTLLLTGLLGGAIALGAPAVIRVLGPRLSPEALDLAARQLVVMAPLIPIGGLIGVLCGVQNVGGKFASASLSPLVSSVTVIAWVLISPDAVSIAWGTLAGALGQLLLQGGSVVRNWQTLVGGGAGRVNLRDPEFRAMLGVLGPAALTSSIGTLNVAIATAFASRLPAGTISTFNYANLLLQLPMGILLTALLVPMFPRLSEAAAREDHAGLLEWLERGTGLLLVTMVPLAALVAMLGAPAIQLAFERGAFGPEDTLRTAMALAILAVSMPLYSVRDLYARFFYARQESRVTATITLLSVGANIGFNTLLLPWGLAGLATATVLVTAFNLVALGFHLRRRLGTLTLGRQAPRLGRLALALLPGLGWPLLIRGWSPWSGLAGALFQLVVAGGGAMVLILATLAWLREPMLGSIPGLRGRLDRVRPPENRSSSEDPGIVAQGD